MKNQVDRFFTWAERTSGSSGGHARYDTRVSRSVERLLSKHIVVGTLLEGFYMATALMLFAILVTWGKAISPWSRGVVVWAILFSFFAITMGLANSWRRRTYGNEAEPVDSRDGEHIV